MYIHNTQFKTIHVAINFIAKDNFDQRPYRFLLPKLLLKKTRKYPSLQALNHKQDDLYSTVVEANNQVLNDLNIIRFDLYFVKPEFVKDKTLYREIADFIDEVIFNHDTFDQSDLDVLIKNTLDAFKTRKDNKIKYAHHRFLYHFLGKNDPSVKHLSGSKQAIKKMTSKAMLDYYQNSFSNDRSMVIINGDVSNSFIKRLEAKYNKQSDEVKAKIKKPKYYLEKQTIVEKSPIKQANILMAYQISGYQKHYLKETMLLANIILGDSGNARLFTEIREKANLAYQVSSNYYKLNDFLFVFASVDTNNSDETIALIQKEMIRFSNYGVTKQELQTAKLEYINSLNEASDSQTFITHNAWMKHLGMPYIELLDKIAEINQITLSDVNEAIKHLTYKFTYVLKGETDDY